MKKISLLLLVIIVAVGDNFAQCNTYYNFKEGTVYEIESYNAKDKAEGKTVNKVINYSNAGDGFEATIHSTLYDKKEKELHSGDFKMSCKNGTMLIDMKKFIPEESLKSMQGAEMEITGDFLEFPTKLTVGQTLKDGSIEMKMNTGQPVGMSTTISIKDRKVEAKEKITTPAGTFDCYKITYSINSKTNMMGMNINNNMKAEEWVSEGVGAVKTSTYNAKGGLIGYTLLTKYQK